MLFLHKRNCKKWIWTHLWLVCISKSVKLHRSTHGILLFCWAFLGFAHIFVFDNNHTVPRVTSSEESTWWQVPWKNYLLLWWWKSCFCFPVIFFLIDLFLTMLGLCCCADSSLVSETGDCSLVAVHSLPICRDFSYWEAKALGHVGFSSCYAWAWCVGAPGL